MYNTELVMESDKVGRQGRLGRTMLCVTAGELRHGPCGAITSRGIELTWLRCI
jgi:hypothetical protein